MKIVSWTLAGPGTAPIIGDALRSVSLLVDAALTIRTWDGDDADLWAAIGGMRYTSTPSFFVREWPWQNDFAAARNHAIERVAALPGIPDWALMLDTDERVICQDPAAVRAWLAEQPDRVQVVLVHHNDGSHTRERFFRMPARYKFRGRTHEMYECPSTEQAIAPSELIQWSELPKSREQLRAKFERDVRMLREDLSDHPNGAALYYLGVSLQSLAIYDREDGNETAARARFEEAIDCYRRHRALDTTGAPAWHEGTAWSCYRAAECYLSLGQPDRAIDCAVAGMVLDAGIAELPWIASVASLQVGRLEQARCWAKLARVHALGSEAERRRVGFRLPRGLTTGPEEILAAVRGAIGSSVAPAMALGTPAFVYDNYPLGRTRR